MLAVRVVERKFYVVLVTDLHRNELHRNELHRSDAQVQCFELATVICMNQFVRNQSKKSPC